MGTAITDRAAPDIGAESAEAAGAGVAMAPAAGDTIDRELLALHEMSHAAYAILVGHGVNRVSILPSGNDTLGHIETTAPRFRDAWRVRLERAEIHLAGAFATGVVGDADMEVAIGIARDLTATEEEAAALLNWLAVRVRQVVEGEDFQELTARLAESLLDSAGIRDLNHPAQHDTEPPNIYVQVNPTPIQVDVAAPIVNVEVAAPDKEITFVRDGDGNIVAASSESA